MIWTTFIIIIFYGFAIVTHEKYTASTEAKKE